MNRQINPFYAVLIITIIGASCTFGLVKKIYAIEDSSVKVGVNLLPETAL
jgi:hypothetical protein